MTTFVETQRNSGWKSARWNRQRNDAIRREQTEKCYKQYTPPQCRRENRRG